MFYDASGDALIQALLAAGKTPPTLLTNAPTVGLLRTYQKAAQAGHPFAEFGANQASWYFRVALTAYMDKQAGQNVTSDITIPVKVASAQDVLTKFGNDLTQLPDLAPLFALLPDAWVTKAYQ